MRFVREVPGGLCLARYSVKVPGGLCLARYSVTLLVLLLGAAAARGELRDELRDLIAARRYEQALRSADAALREEPESVVAWQYRAYALHQLGRTTEARRAYEHTNELDASNWWSRMNLGSLLASQGLFADALAPARKAVELRPDVKDTWAKLTRVHRGRRAWGEARSTVRLALETGIEPLWCHRELAELAWIVRDLEDAEARWERAERLGADADAVAHGRQLVAWEREMHRRLPDAPPPADWVLTVGQIEVWTKVGPKLPRSVTRIIRDAQTDLARWLGVRGEWPLEVRLHLSRTIEEHEVHRRREFPSAHRGSAFHVDRRWSGPRRGGRFGRAPRRGRFDLYVAWPKPGLERSLSHEILHSVLRLRIPSSTDLPLWLDEGLATWAEPVTVGNGRPRRGAVRPDLLALLRAAREAGEARSLGSLLGLQYRTFRGEDTRLHYAEAWALVRFLVEKRGGKSRLRAYLDRIDRPRADTVRAFREVYGDDLEELEALWWRYVDDIAGE
jgi:tetratricopeptide (TPR) repeat protein